MEVVLKLLTMNRLARLDRDAASELPDDGDDGAMSSELEYITDPPVCPPCCRTSNSKYL